MQRSKNTPIYSLCLLWVLSLILFASGCAKHPLDNDHHLANVQKMGTPQIAEDYASSGIMTKDDYWHINSIFDKINIGGPLSQDDVDWLINLMQKPTINRPIRNAKVMAAFLSVKPKPTQEQRSKIIKAISPLTKSKSEMEVKYAQHVIRIMSKP